MADCLTPLLLLSRQDNNPGHSGEILRIDVAQPPDERRPSPCGRDVGA